VSKKPGRDNGTKANIQEYTETLQDSLSLRKEKMLISKDTNLDLWWLHGAVAMERGDH
jgi:hypothetical protein